MAAPALVSEADDSDGQWLVLRRRIRSLFGCDLALAAEEARFGLSETNWGILPGGGATKVAVELLPFRKAMYPAMMDENVDGKTAANLGQEAANSYDNHVRKEGIRQFIDEKRKKPGLGAYERDKASA